MRYYTERDAHGITEEYNPTPEIVFWAVCALVCGFLIGTCAGPL